MARSRLITVDGTVQTVHTYFMDKNMYAVLNTIATTNAKAKIAALLVAQAKMSK